MSRSGLLAAFLLGVVVVGCAPPPVAAYNIKAFDDQVYKEKLDARWFVREIRSGESGSLEAVELVYCPLVNPPPTVCRTGIVWRRGESALVR